MPLLTSCCFRGPAAREVWPFLHVPKARQLSVARSAPSWLPELFTKAPSAATATISVLPWIEPALASHWAASAHSRRNTLRGYETVLELSYQVQALPWLQVQPDFQYVVSPGGGIPNPNQPGQLVGSAAVFGLRIIATF
jgi:Carbohydrate-selective porin, OprB family